MVQNWIVGKITTRLSKDLNTEISIRHVSLTFFNRMNLEGTLVKDQRKDTLLYANQVKVRITDWFFLQDTIALKFIGLEDATVNLYRKDERWNYQFLIDHFSPDKPSQKKSKLQFQLKKVDLVNVHLVQNDVWKGKKLVAKVGNLLLDARVFDLENRTFHITDLQIDKPTFGMYSFAGLRPPPPPTAPQPDTGYYFNQGDITVRADKITIRNGTFINDIATDRPVYKWFDGEHLQFEQINATLQKVSFVKDTIKADVHLATRERSGFEVKSLQANFKLTPQVMEFARLDLVTPRSHLQNYYAMQFGDFNRDFAHYIDSVVMVARFQNSTIDTDDIAFFAPEVKSWNKKAAISGIARGPVSNLDIKKLFVRTASNTVVMGDLALKGLPDVENMVILFNNGTIKTNYRDAISVLPDLTSVTSPSLPSLGEVQFQGSYRGTISTFRAAGNVTTALGAFSADLSFQVPKKGSPVYDGKLVTRRFNLGKFLQTDQLGLMAFNGAIKGRGFKLADVRTEVKGHFDRFDFNSYPYADIDVEGIFQRRQFDGTVKINDDNLNLTTTVKIDLTGDQPRYNVLGDLAESDFLKLNFGSRPIKLTGLFDLDYSGKNIDQFLGSIKIFNATLVQDSVRITVDSLTLQSEFVNNQRLLVINSNEFDARVVGEYNILDLPLSFQVFLHKYYPAYIKAPKREPKNQRFLFEVNTRGVDEYVKLLDSNLDGLSYANVSGNINTIDTIFTINATVPLFSYKQYGFTNVYLEGIGNLDNLKLDGNIEEIAVSDSTRFPNTSISIVSQKDVSQVSIHTQAYNTLNELNLNAQVTSLDDGVRVKFNPSDFVINDKRWTLEKEGEIVIRKRFVSADNVRFTQADQVIEVASDHDTDFDQSNLVVKLSNINIGDFSPFITKSPRIEGLANGNIVLHDFYGNFAAEANLKATQFRVDNDSIGILNLTGVYSTTTGRVNFAASSPNQLYNFTLNGHYLLADSAELPLHTSIQLNNTRINFLNMFLNTLFTDIQGTATGMLELNGKPQDPQLLGRVTLRNASMLVNFTQVRYTVDSAYFVFKEDVMDFGRFRVKDKFGNTGTVSGKIFARGFNNMRFDFDMSTNRMLLIDTKANDNEQFYGTAIGKATLSLTGPQNDIRMQITGEATDSSHIYIPTTITRESAEADFIVFKQYGTEMKLVNPEGEANMVVDLDLTANPLVKVDVILDELTGDIIKANGFGRLRIHVGTNDDLTINGRYEIQRGSYDFNFQSFIRKPFILREDAGSFIEWNGDPYNARINIEALYVAENVRLGDLVGNQGLGGAVQGYKGDVYVIANLTDNLLKPSIRFRLDFPTGSQVKNDDTFNQFLSKIQNDDNEMLKQVTYLIVFGQFAPYGEGRNIGSNFTSFGFNTISEMISKQVNNVVSNLLYKITGDRSLQFDVSTSVYNSSSLFSGNVTASNIDRQQVNFKLGYGLFNNKVVITFGGDLDFRMGNAASATAASGALSNVQWLPDLTVEIILSQDRKLRAIVFNRNNLDISSGDVGRRNRQGVSISYRKEFPSIATETKPFADKPPDSTGVKRPARRGGSR